MEEKSASQKAEEMILDCMEKVTRRISELAEIKSAESDKSLCEFTNGMRQLTDALYLCGEF